MIDRKQVLFTGAAGKIGTALLEAFKNIYVIRTLDVQISGGAGEHVVANILDFESVWQAMQGVDVVIHLAANPSPYQSWDEAYTTGIAGTFNIFEAARLAGVRKIIYASSAHVLGIEELQFNQFVRPDDPICPDSPYGLSKACGEILGQFFADRYGLSVICLRIGSFVPNIRRSWLKDLLLYGYCSPSDFADLVYRSIEVDNLGFQIFYGVSANRRCLWDISNAQQLIGYHPQDNAEDWLPIMERRQDLITLVHQKNLFSSVSKLVSSRASLRHQTQSTPSQLQLIQAKFSLADSIAQWSSPAHSWDEVYTRLGRMYQVLMTATLDMFASFNQFEEIQFSAWPFCDRHQKLDTWTILNQTFMGVLVHFFERCYRENSAI